MSGIYMRLSLRLNQKLISQQLAGSRNYDLTQDREA
ncbi:MAG: hypothetical protein QOF72_657 [Blastocatellia bacterium]|jgi:hypothetical protein|nr:hypothetical protein [Blastocatellia bacterium]MDX6577163.1 hypothetical protein [Blastocatellia bacterium]